MKANSPNYIELEQVSHAFGRDDKRVVLFENINLLIHQGQSYAITGPSGSGKSSLLMLMSGLESPAQGAVNTQLDGQSGGAEQLKRNTGFIFQQFHLLPDLSALHNVALPLKLRGVANAEQRAKDWLQQVGLAHRLNHIPKELSGGEQQRVAIARSLVFEPSFIFADEPTGNLDGNNANDIADLLFSCCQHNGAGLIIVTHSNELAERAQHQFFLKNGACHVTH